MNRFKNWKPPKMKHGKLTKWNWLPYYPKNIIIGKNVDIGAFSFLQGKYGIIIEPNVQIGSHVSIYSEDTERKINGQIVIKKGVLIGSHATIFPRDKLFIINFNVKAGSVIY